jgi:deoxyribonuclease-4
LTREGGLARIVAALDSIYAETPEKGARILLENTAGQGSNLGWQFCDLAEILGGVRESERLGVCIDTCHAFAAGYDLSREESYHAAWEEFERLVGLAKIRAIHLNDSKRELGSRVDRHEHIGQGHLGREAFGRLLTDPRFAALPMYLETPKGDHEGRPWDVINLETLRDLAAGQR